MSGSLFIVSAPSGAGKTTLVKKLLAEDTELSLSISYTTRQARDGEQNDLDYHFCSVDEFMRRRDSNEFVEWAEVHGNYYATSAQRIRDALDAGNDLLLEIDWQGAAQVRRLFPAAVNIFILPPSLAELENRLRGRGTDSDEVIARRLQGAHTELSHLMAFDYVIINDRLETASRNLLAIVQSARQRRDIQALRHAALFNSFTQE